MKVQTSERTKKWKEKSSKKTISSKDKLLNAQTPERTNSLNENPPKSPKRANS